MTLSDRIAALDGPSREINDEIDAALGWRKVDNPTFAGGLIDMWHTPDGTIGRRNEALHQYTGSLDAAMTLVPEGADIDIQLTHTRAWLGVSGPVAIIPYPGHARTVSRCLAAHSP